MTINFYLDRKPNKKELLIFLYIRNDGQTMKFITGEKVSSKYWDIKKQKVKRGHPESMEINKLLEFISLNVRKLQRENFMTGQRVSIEMFREKVDEFLKNRHPQNLQFELFDALDEYISTGKPEIKESTKKVYLTLKQHLANFNQEKRYKLNFDKIDLKFYTSFYGYCIKELGMTNNTFSKQIRTLKAFLNWAGKRNYPVNNAYKEFKRTDEEADTVVLTEKELMRLYKLNLKPGSTKDGVRDVFCFACFTGARFGDIKALKRSDIKNEVWIVRTGKTKQKVEIPLNKYALEILNKHKNEDTPLPIISSQKTNSTIKEICSMAEIDSTEARVRYKGSERIEVSKEKYEMVSMHTARRTFITLALEKGMRPEVVMSISGHHDYRSFKKYIKLASEVKRQEMNKIWK